MTMRLKTGKVIERIIEKKIGLLDFPAGRC